MTPQNRTFPPLKNDSYLRAVRRQATEHTPVWLMRQAGRYLPEYLATRSRAGSFMGLATNPELACEVTLQPLDRYPLLDAAILFSDILTVPDAMGLGLSFAQGEGPKFAKPLRTEADVAALHAPDLNQLKYVFDAVTTIRSALNGRVPLIGFSGSPWTLACYMVEGGGSDDFRTIKTMLYSRPDLIARIIDINTQAVSEYLLEQVKAGAQALMIFDTWGGVLPDGVYQSVSLSSMQRIVATLKAAAPEVPVTVFTKGGGIWLQDIASIGADCVGVDWTVNLARARAAVGHQVALQGNVDPFILMGSDAAITQHVHAAMGSYAGTQGSLRGITTGHNTGHVFNLGHGINQFTPPAAVEVMLNAVKSYRLP
jgi:uroporphyrinogen decarboxylase